MAEALLQLAANDSVIAQEIARLDQKVQEIEPPGLGLQDLIGLKRRLQSVIQEGSEIRVARLNESIEIGFCLVSKREELADSAFEDWFQTILADPPEGVRRILRRRSGRQSPREQLRNAMQTLRERRDFSEPWRRETFDRNGAIDALMSTASRERLPKVVLGAPFQVQLRQRATARRSDSSPS